MKGTLVSILILTYNSAADLPAVLSSIRTQTYPHLEVLILDNASKDDSAAIARRHGYKCDVSPVNSGYAAGMNRLYAASRGDLVIPLNADCSLSPRFVEEVVGASLSSPAEIFAPLVVSTPGSAGRLSEAIGSAVDPLPVDAALSRISREMRTVRFRPSGTVTMTGVKPAGPCPVLRRSFVSQLEAAYGPGIFDETFVTYGEDIDLALRAYALGAQVCYVPKAVAYHARSASTAGVRAGYKKSGLILVYVISARYVNAVRHLAARHLPGSIARMIFEDLGAGVVSVAKRPGVLVDLASAWRRVLQLLPGAVRFRRKHRTSAVVSGGLVASQWRRGPVTVSPQELAVLLRGPVSQEPEARSAP